MAEGDPLATRQSYAGDLTAELADEGFGEAQEIGRGGFGIVYRCAQPTLDRTVAVKVLNSDLDDENIDRFLREQRAMGRLSGHPNIATIMQVGVTTGGRPYLVMPFYAKGSLEALIAKHGPLDWVEMLSVGVKIAGALDAAHGAGILHRDVKPGNILLSDYGEPQLTDFGIARVSGGFQTSSGLITGSPAFTAPEVLEGGAPSVVSDVYSLGATLFCALTGHAAFERRQGEKVVAQFLRITSQPIPDLRERGMPDDVAAAIEQAMSRDPAERPASVSELGDILREVQQHNKLGVDVMARPVELGVERQAPAPSAERRRTVTPPPTPATKYRPATPVKGLVNRERLTRLLREGDRRRLVFIHAPLGYGKSTLAAQWRDELTGAGVAVGWLTIDEDDNNVVWFLAHLVEAIRRVRPGLAESLGATLEEHGENADRYVLTALVDGIHASGERMAVVIDDWHRVSDPRTSAALGLLIDNGCHHLQLIVTSWSGSGLPLSKLRIHDELVEINENTMRFDVEEARALLLEVGKLDLSPEDVAALTTSTDGWAAALQLATLSLRGAEDAVSLIARIAGHDGVVGEVVGEFLAENVLDTLEPELLDYLMLTSITSQICGPLAEALTGLPGGQARLEDVERRGLFLRRACEDRTWFRYHHMFAEFLRRRLQRDRPGIINELHRAAAAWFAANHDLNDAVDHALAAGDPAYAIELVEQDETYLLEQSKMTTFLAIVKKLPPQAVVARAPLQLVIAWANILLQRRAETYTALNRFETALRSSGLPESVQTDLRVDADVVRSVAEAFGDHIDRIEALVAEVLARPDSLPPRVAGVAGNIATFAAIYRFDYAAARRHSAFAARYHDLMGAFAPVYRLCFDAIAAKHQLDISGAMDALRQAHGMGAELGPHSHAVRVAGALLGELLYDTGELAEASRIIEESYVLGSEGGAVDYMIALYGTAARLKAADGDLDAAATRLSDGMRAAERLDLPRLAAVMTNLRIRLGLPVTPDVASRLHASSAVIAGVDGIATITAEFEEDCAVRLLAASDSADDRAEALRRAEQLDAGIDGAQRPWAALQAGLLVAETLVAAGRQADGLGHPAVARCAELGLTRILEDAGLA
ncbi:serine/threonine-protein kinase [Mycobacterium aquaticum]|uniref:non-specific serine/threonine protein kinase n=1 Tax=Mycobacterium aquaticum TaxID=1927124 RepID=A0A1X0AWM1_9MYCO|nr:serine/threonine-protein kinase [Mycobacterium aquaticum]ORA34471.1 serine/threonine-protein kinase PknK [Mycobacterium aquaticum]